ncbi:DNA mismatch repair protein MutT [Bacillus sp. FJAT-27264]|uniref:NUDIX domain-containing protein n=1 Tax=Paenibacillus sp. (strain DSM 101736 / FJAT-27264) TaxID=1850362 RepID=UPI000807B7C0|nr:NUDIX domain-containing protein [Bacillus sp. FJAT-27264]OBZ14725.1 DNA mismatch repair protein MutT [Bacillus sp. FJAT-27264]
MEAEKRPRVGVGAVIRDENNRILLVLRKKPPEAGHWSLPGGKVDYMETIEHAVIREIREELGLEIEIERLLCVTNHILPAEDVHYVAPTFLANIVSGDVQNQEPHALEKVQWFSMQDLPNKITMTTDYALKQLNSSINLE